MHALKILPQMLKKHGPKIHTYRLASLMDTVESLTYGQTLTVTGLGRSSLRTISMKYAIKQSDRLVGHRHLFDERHDTYKAVTRLLLGSSKRPLIVVDWSDYRHARRQQLLQASVPVGGRALTLYEEVHPLKDDGKARVHHQFLDTSGFFLCSDSCPVIITDAGFIGP